MTWQVRMWSLQKTGELQPLLEYTECGHKDERQFKSRQPRGTAEEAHVYPKKIKSKKNTPLEPRYIWHKYQESYKRNMDKKA